MDHPITDASQQQEPGGQSKRQLTMLRIVNKTEERPNTSNIYHQLPSHIWQVQQRDVRTSNNCEQGQNNHDQQAQLRDQINNGIQSCTEKYFNLMTIRGNKEVQHIRELQSQDGKNVELGETQLNQELHQRQFDIQRSETQKNHEIESHATHRIQTQNQENQAHKKQKLPTYHRNGQQSQQISSIGQTFPLLLIPDQKQMKVPIQNQKHQPSEIDLKLRQQQQQFKKLKKKQVGENQERINFLVQASQTMGLLAKSSSNVLDQQALAAQVGTLGSTVGRRCVLRLDPGLKRCLCKGCGTVLVYSLNARVRHRSRRQKHLVVTCLTCRTIKRFVNNPKYKLWVEQEEALV